MFPSSFRGRYVRCRAALSTFQASPGKSSVLEAVNRLGRGTRSSRRNWRHLDGRRSRQRRLGHGTRNPPRGWYARCIVICSISCCCRCCCPLILPRCDALCTISSRAAKRSYVELQGEFHELLELYHQAVRAVRERAKANRDNRNVRRNKKHHTPQERKGRMVQANLTSVSSRRREGGREGGSAIIFHTQRHTVKAVVYDDIFCAATSIHSCASRQSKLLSSAPTNEGKKADFENTSKQINIC